MNNEEKLTTEIIEAVKKNYILNRVLNSNKGKQQNITYWRVNNYRKESYLYSSGISYSYQQRNTPQQTFDTVNKQEIRFGLIINCKSNLPNIHIRPKTFYDRLNSLFDSNKNVLKQSIPFNKKYIIETDQYNEASKYLTNDLLNKIACEDGLFLTYTNKKIQISTDLKQSVERVENLLGIGNLIDGLE